MKLRLRTGGYALAIACGIGGLILTQTIGAGAPNGKSSAGKDGPDPWRALQTIQRAVPVSAPAHPGNVFQTGETVSVPLPPELSGKPVRWQAVDDAGKVVGEGAVNGTAPVTLGALGIGWYRVAFSDAQGKELGWTTAAVLARLAEPVPQDSPVCCDSATSWFARNNAAKQEVLARLAALAGVNWIRDRMSWGEMETAPGVFAKATGYDSSATLEAAQGLKVLQVFHSTPAWAVDKALDGQEGGKRFPRDLRIYYRFCKAMAQRFKGRVRAWEPWNEANISGFGGATIDEMSTLQKAAYLGFKAGDPQVTVCWNVFAGPGNRLQTDGVLENEAWPYFETYDIHSYSRPESYLSEMATACEGCSGRPIWISECGIHVSAKTPRPWGDLSHENEIRQAEFVAHSYVNSLFVGVNRHFFFILGNYLEWPVQFGLLRADQTPRPGYSALAAVGRLLAGARCLGRVPVSGDSPLHVYAFRGRPDGRDRDVLIAWADKPSAYPRPADLKVDAAYDYLGRTLPPQLPGELRPAAVFLVLPAGESSKLKLEAPPAKAAYRTGTPSPVVLQLQAAAATTRLDQQAHQVEAGQLQSLPLYVYNFSDKPVEGTVAVETAPQEWKVSVPTDRIRIAPFDRQQLTVQVRIPGPSHDAVFGGWVKLRGAFDDAGRPVLAFRLVADMSGLKPSATKPITSAEESTSWQDNIVGGAKMTHTRYDTGGFLFDMKFGQTDPWSYPLLTLQPGEVPDSSWDGLAVTIQMLEGVGTIRVQFVEESGAAYLTDVAVNPEVHTPQRVVALFSGAAWGPYSAPDPDGKLDPGQIRRIMVGINSKRNSTVKMVISDMAWVKY